MMHRDTLKYEFNLRYVKKQTMRYKISIFIIYKNVIVDSIYFMLQIGLSMMDDILPPIGLILFWRCNNIVQLAYYCIVTPSVHFDERIG